MSAHSSNWKSAEDNDDITSSLLQEELQQNWIVPFEGDLQTARETFPLGVAVGKLSVAFSDHRPPRLVLDPSISGANAAFHVPEKQNLPTAFEVSRAFPLRGTVEPQSAFSLDIKSAHKRVVVRKEEQGLLMLQYKGKLFHYQVAPFGAKFSQHWWGRLGSFLLRFYHAFLYIKHAMYLFVDDYLLTSLAKLLPLQATILVILCRLFHIPISWTKCTLGPRQTWIGWQFDFNAGLIFLHKAKQQKLLRMIAEIRKHSKVKKKTIEKFLGLAMWSTSIFPTMRVHLHWLYSDLAKPQATLYSCQPGDWAQLCTCLTADLVFRTRPQGTSIPVGARLISVKHKEVKHTSDLASIPITERRIWMRVADPKSATRTLSGSSMRVLQLFSTWLQYGPPLVSMRPKPAWEGAAFSDAHANGSHAGIGGFIETPQGHIFWFSLQLTAEDFKKLDIPLHDDLQKDIVFLETLSQLALIHAFVQITGHCRLPLKIFTQTDNTGTEAVVNSLFSTQFPLALVLEKISIVIANHGLILDAQHIPGKSNVDADFLSRWTGTPDLPQKFQPNFRVQISIETLWKSRAAPAVYPIGSTLSWLPTTTA